MMETKEEEIRTRESDDKMQRDGVQVIHNVSSVWKIILGGS
jgi:hypothetical protein